jgi:predicted HTH domain antitoxin
MTQIETFHPNSPFASFVDPDEGRLLMAIKLFEIGRATLGQAAELAGYTKAGFIDVLGHHGIPVLNSPAAELADEIAW